MPYLPGAATPAATPPPEEEYVEPTPVAATEEEAVYGPAPAPQAETPAAATEEETVYGPFTSAVQGVQSGLGQAVAPLQEALPQPVRNLTDIVGQPVGGALDAVTAVTTELGQGDLPGAAGAALQAAGGPQMRSREQAGQRVAEGQPVVPGLDEIVADPGNLLALQPGAVLSGVPAIKGKPTIDDWAAADPQAVAEAEALGGGNAVVDAYLESVAASPIPPPQLSNPFDAAAFDGNPIERGLAVAGAVPDFLGGWVDAGREGALGPFLRNQIIETAMDPLLLVPPAVGSRVGSTVGRAARAGVGRLPGNLLDLSPAEQARLRAENVGTAAGEYLDATRTLDDSGTVPAAGVTPGAQTPALNGRQPSPVDPGQPLAAAPPIPPPDPYGFPRYEHVTPVGPLRPRSPLTGRPVIPPGTRPEIEGPLRAQLDGMGLRDVGVTLVNDLRDAAPDARPIEQARYLPDSNSIALALDNSAPADWPALIEREARRAVQEQSQRQATQAAYAAAPAAAQRIAAATPQPRLTRHGVVVSEPAARDLATPAEGVFRFADGYRPGRGMTAEDVFNETLRDAEYWATADDLTSRRWQDLDRRFNPDGSIDRETMRGPASDPVSRARRDRHAFAVYEDAMQRALPRNAPQTKLGYLNQQYLATVRRVMLFNPFRIPSYTVQNLITNSINLGARVGPRAVLDLWTRPADLARVFRNARSLGEGKPTYHTHFGSLQAKMKAGTKPNIPMSHAAYFDRLGGKAPKWLERVQRALAPNTSRYIGTMADQLPREVAATRTIYAEYRKLNREMPAKIRQELYNRNVRVPEAKIAQVWADFRDANRTITDLNTNAPYRTILGREAKYEPVWAADDLAAHLKAHLTEEMREAPDAGEFARAIDRIGRDSKNRVRGILDSADTAADDALFAWRNTNADEMAGKLFLYHFWTSRQGGLYVTEAMKRPYLMSAYGRMMAEFEQQADDLEQPNWMKGFFQMQNSVAGYSIWFSPFDLAQSLLTFADWQYGEDSYAEYKDLTALGKGAGMAPFLIHPLLQMVGYSLGLLGPDYYAPPVTGAETYGANAINLLNLANANGTLPSFVNEMNIGVDANGNKVPLPVRPLQELYARFGHELSKAMAPITGLSPVEVFNAGGSMERNIASFVESDYRRAHPEADQQLVNEAVTEILMDHGSAEYQAAFRKAADLPYAAAEGMPGLLSGIARVASPVRVHAWPEQYNLDRWALTDTGHTPPRNIPNLGEFDAATDELTPAGERAKDVYNAAKYGATATPEARHLSNLKIQHDQLEPLDYAEANDLAQAIYYGLEESVTVGGQEYTPEQVAAMSSDDRYALGTQALADAGYTREDQQRYRDAQSQFVADHPELAGYLEYRDLVGYSDEAQQQFVTETALTNPGFAQYVRSSLMDHITGEIDYGAATYPQAYLAAIGVRPSVYSPLTGNEPSRIPGGYPELAGQPSGEPLIPEMATAPGAPFPLYSKPLDTNEWYAGDEVVGMADPSIAPNVDVIGGPDPEFGMVKVRIGGTVGFVDPAFLATTSPPQPNLPPGPAPAPVQPTGGLAGMAGAAVSALGTVKDALGNAVVSLTGHNSGEPTKPANLGMAVAPGTYDVVPSADGLGVQSTRDGSDRTWMEQMVGPGSAAVSVDYKQPVTWNVDYSYQNGHGADGSTHAAYDITCDDPNGRCAGTPISAPLAGRVVCAGYGAGTGEAMASPNCTYSEGTTAPGQAHTVVLDVGPDAAGNAIQLSFNHMGESALTPGQTVNVGDALGTMGDTDAGPHIHVEGWGWCPSQNTYILIDPQLIVGGHYGQNAVC